MKNVYKAIHPKNTFEAQLAKYDMTSLRVYAFMLDAILLEQTHPLSSPSVDPMSVGDRKAMLNRIGQGELMEEIRRMRRMVME